MSSQPITGGPHSSHPASDRGKVEDLQYNGTYGQRSNHDKLASDRIGEELNPDACIWRLYAEEAKEHDTEMAQERNKNLDTMLLFATLFSAIVTAFLIESTNLLEPDSSEVSKQLLLMLVQSQRRIEAGKPDPSSSPVEIPKFTPSVAVRFINVLWFASLMTSLGAAVVAILAKEWLSAFVSYRTRHAHEYALQRRARLLSLSAWNMLPVIDLLPTVLNCALFLFSLGLIIRLWLLDFVVAGITTIITAAVCGIYLFFVISGAIHDTCPYKARLSFYLQWILPQSLFTNSPTSKSTTRDTQDTVNPEEIDLLIWLLNCSANPTLGSYVIQALAGLRSLGLGLPTFLSKGVPISELYSTYNQTSEVFAPLLKLGAQGVDQLRMSPTRRRNELAYRGGSDVARLATAMGEIYPYALTWQLCAPEETVQAPRNYSQVTPVSSIPHRAKRDSTPVIDINHAHKITENVFSALDEIWAETSPALTPSAYAYLATAELKMIRLALALLSPGGDRRTPPSSGHSVIDIGYPIDLRARLPSLDENTLQERSARALSRTALVIKSSLDLLVSKGSQEVQTAIFHLLLEATELVKQEMPRSNGGRRFGTAPSSDVLNEEISITVAVGDNKLRRVTCKILARNLELMESLVEVSGSDTSADTLCLEGFRVAAFNLLLTFWPAYLQQSKIDETMPCNFSPWEVQGWEVVPCQGAPFNSRKSAEVIIYQYIVLTYVAMWLWKSPEAAWEWKNRSELDLFRLVLRVLSTGSIALPKITRKLGDDNVALGRVPIFRQWLPTNEILEKWICGISRRYLDPLQLQFVIEDETPRRLSWCIACLINMAKTLGSSSIDICAWLRSAHSVTDHGNPTSEDFGLGVNETMVFLQAASQAVDRDNTSPVVEELLRHLTRYILEASPCCEVCLQNFTEGPGFDILTKIGKVELDRIAVVDTVFAVLDKLHKAKLLVKEGVVPSLFAVMRYACDVGDEYLLSLFVASALFQLEGLPGGIGQFATQDNLLLIHKIINKLEYLAKEATGVRASNASSYIDRITALKRLVQSPGHSSRGAGGAPPIPLVPESPDSQTTLNSWDVNNTANHPVQNFQNANPPFNPSNHADKTPYYHEPAFPNPGMPEPQPYTPSLELNNRSNNPSHSTQNYTLPWDVAGAQLFSPTPEFPVPQIDTTRQSLSDATNCSLLDFPGPEPLGESPSSIGGTSYYHEPVSPGPEFPVPYTYAPQLGLVSELVPTSTISNYRPPNRPTRHVRFQAPNGTRGRAQSSDSTLHGIPSLDTDNETSDSQDEANTSMPIRHHLPTHGAASGESEDESSDGESTEGSGEY